MDLRLDDNVALVTGLTGRMKNCLRPMSIACLMIAVVVAIQGDACDIERADEELVCGIDNHMDIVTSRLTHLVVQGIFPQPSCDGTGKRRREASAQHIAAAGCSERARIAADLLLVETGPGLPEFSLLSTVLGMLVLAQFVAFAVNDVRATDLSGTSAR